MKFISTLVLALYSITPYAQEDSVKTYQPDGVTISDQRDIKTIDRLPDIQKTFLWSGKKNEVINVQNIDANLTEKTPRQIFAKVPGVFVYINNAANKHYFTKRPTFYPGPGIWPSDGRCVNVSLGFKI